MITVPQLAAMTSLRVPLLTTVHKALQPAIQVAQLTTPRRLAHFIAQWAYETGMFAHLVENLNYTPEALTKKWPTRFSPELALKLGRTREHPANQQQIAVIAYGGRGGNRPAPSLDGWTYRGRGWPQLTHRDNYTAFAAWSGVDVVKNPDLVAEHGLGAMAAAWYWQQHKLNEHADRNDVPTVSRIINCGPHSKASQSAHGLMMRKAKTELCLNVLQEAA